MYVSKGECFYNFYLMRSFLDIEYNLMKVIKD